jgi:hypothetical protein
MCQAPTQAKSSWTLRRMEDGPPRCFASSEGVDVDTEGRHVAFSVIAQTRGSSAWRDGVVHLSSISWYAVVDVASGGLVVSGAKSLTARPQTADRVVGWSANLVVKRSRLLYAGRELSSTPAEAAKLASDEVSIVLVSKNGVERVLRSFVCEGDPRVPVPPPCSEFLLGNFKLCPHRDCLVFTRFAPAFRKSETGETVLDGSRCRDSLHVIDLGTGKERVIGETPTGWRCKDVCYDCRSGNIHAVLASVKRDGTPLLGLARGSARAPTPFRVLRVVEKTFQGWLSPDGSVAALVDGSGEKDTSTVILVPTGDRGKVNRELVVPGWRRRVLWSRDSRKLLLWYHTWFHDPLGRKFQRMHEGYRFWIADNVGAKAYPVGPKWAGNLAITWSRDNKGLFVVANGVLGYLDVQNGGVKRIWEFPEEWYQFAD